MTSNRPRIAGGTKTRSDPSWKGLYLAGSMSAALYVALIILPLVLIFSGPQPPLVDGAALLQYIATHRSVYMIELVSFVGLSVPAMIVFLALYVALEPVNRSYAAIGALFGIASETIALGYGSSPPSLHTGLLNLSNQYMTATSEAQRAVLATAAESLMVLSNAANAGGILTALAILILSLVMLKSTDWQRVGYLGILTGTSGIVCETLREVFPSIYFIYGIFLPIWFIAVGWKLYRLEQTRQGAT